MKKTITTLAGCMMACLTYAQSDIPGAGLKQVSPNQRFGEVGVEAKGFSKIGKPNPTIQAASNLRLNYVTAKANWEIGVNSVPQNKFANFANVIYMDSTVNTGSSQGASRVSDMRAGVVLDPKSPYYGPGLSGLPILAPTESYRIDTIFISGIYRRVNNVSDTLLVEISFADTISTTVWEALNIPTANQSWIAPKVGCNASSGNKSFLTAPANRKLTFKRVLTNADTAYSTSPFGLDVVVKLPNGGLTIPANNVVAATYTFIPGKSVAPGSVVYAYPNSTDPQTENGFAGLLSSQADLLPDFSNDQALFYDKDPNSNKRFFNTSLSYYPRGRYCLWPSQQVFLNNVMLPGANYAWYIEFSINANWINTSINESTMGKLKVRQNAPNPFNDFTNVSYELAENAAVSMDIFDISGKKVQTIEEGKKSAGNHTLQFNSANLQAGVYFYTLNAGENRVTKRMTIVK